MKHLIIVIVIISLISCTPLKKELTPNRNKYNQVTINLPQKWTETLTPTILPTPTIEKQGQFRIIARENPNNSILTDIYILNLTDNKETFLITLDNIDRIRYHLGEYHNGNLYIIKRIGNSNYPSQEWVDELWRYNSKKEGELLYSHKGIDFRVSPSEKYIIVEYLQSNNSDSHVSDYYQIDIIDNDGRNISHFRGDQLIVEEESGLSLVKWSNNSDQIWGVATFGPVPQSYFCIQVPSFTIRIFNVNGLHMGDFQDSDLNPNTGQIVYSDFPPIFDTGTYQKFKDSKRTINLYYYNLLTGTNYIIDKTITNSFRPIWIDDNTIEYKNPRAEGRITYYIKII
jgi:hypothetical protein